MLLFAAAVVWRAFVTPSLPQLSTCSRPEMFLSGVPEQLDMRPSTASVWNGVATVHLGGYPGELLADSHGASVWVRASCSFHEVLIGTRASVVSNHLPAKNSQEIGLAVRAAATAVPSISWVVEQTAEMDTSAPA